MIRLRRLQELTPNGFAQFDGSKSWGSLLVKDGTMHRKLREFLLERNYVFQNPRGDAFLFTINLQKDEVNKLRVEVKQAFGTLVKDLLQTRGYCSNSMVK
jgi:hypothetical protein